VPSKSYAGSTALRLQIELVDERIDAVHSVVFTNVACAFFLQPRT
jgi:hypothetical protein